LTSKQAEQKTGQLVVPGDRLGVIEEFVPDAGTYVQDGVIYSKVIGRVLVDIIHRRVQVHQLVGPSRVPSLGATVLAQVSKAQHDSAGARIFEIGEEAINGVFTGVLHVSDVALKYVDSMFDVCKAGDIIRAKVVSEKNRTYHLSTKEKNLGVVYAFCSNCGTLLEPRRQAMHCPQCGRIEKRKTASDYGKDLLTVRGEIDES
jgi:exosome complex component CSL4